MSDLTVVLLAILFALALPLLICWTAAVMAARAVRDRPVGLWVAAEVVRTGVQLVLISWFPLIPAFLAALVVALASVFWIGAAKWVGPPIDLVASAAAITFAAVTWHWLRPILREEWDRLAGEQSPKWTANRAATVRKRLA